MTSVHPSRLLRAAFVIDAAASGALGLLQVAATDFANARLGLPAEVVFGIGAFMLAYAASLALLARSATVPRIAALIVIVGNSGWVVGCVALAAWYAPLTALGVGYLLLQAAAVAAFAGLQAAGLARSSCAAQPSLQRA